MGQQKCIRFIITVIAFLAEKPFLIFMDFDFYSNALTLNILATCFVIRATEKSLKIILKDGISSHVRHDIQQWT